MGNSLSSFPYTHSPNKKKSPNRYTSFCSHVYRSQQQITQYIKTNFFASSYFPCNCRTIPFSVGIHTCVYFTSESFNAAVLSCDTWHLNCFLNFRKEEIHSKKEIYNNQTEWFYLCQWKKQFSSLLMSVVHLSHLIAGWTFLIKFSLSSDFLFLLYMTLIWIGRSIRWEVSFSSSLEWFTHLYYCTYTYNVWSISTISLSAFSIQSRTVFTSHSVFCTLYNFNYFHAVSEKYSSKPTHITHYTNTIHLRVAVCVNIFVSTKYTNENLIYSQTDKECQVVANVSKNIICMLLEF